MVKMGLSRVSLLFPSGRDVEYLNLFLVKLLPNYFTLKFIY